ncbi:MAG: cystathionine beta-synthase [Myxococcota bacterium]|nr:cystathionine beta-synthase [Myxococcota bacterium]
MTLMPGSVANILDAVGGTPLVKLNKIGAHTQAEIYVKCEYLNPGGSMKDRIAINIINEAEKRGLFQPGGTIVEATSGNTGMGLALVAAVRGYKTIFIMPDKMSMEKIRALRAVGAKVVVTPTDVEPEDPRSYYSVSRRIAEETPNAFYSNQYHNPANPETHYKTTGPEIWAQTGGEFDIFCAGMGTGGTISGTGRFLKEKKPEIQTVGVDPVGSLYYDYFKTGKLTEAHSYKVEGIGEDFLPSTMNFDFVDEVVRVTDKECFDMARRLVREEGVLCGQSCGASVIGAVKYAEMTGRKMRIIAHLPDTAYRYLSKHLDDDWMRENGFLGPDPSMGKVKNMLQNRGPLEIVTAQPKDKVKEIIARMKEHGISQLPVIDSGRLIGTVSERTLLGFLLEGNELGLDHEVGPLVENNFAVVDPATPVASLSGLFNQSSVLVVLEAGDVVGVITKIDLIEYMAAKLG